MKNLILIISIVLPVSLAAQQIDKHTVASGETLQLIANKYNISVNELKKANSGLSNYVIAGMVLSIPKADSDGEEQIVWDMADDLRDIIFMKDSSEVVAKIVNFDTDSVRFEQYDTDMPYAISLQQIVSITFEDGSVKSFVQPQPVKKSTNTRRRTK